jgi:hypothetical protein
MLTSARRWIAAGLALPAIAAAPGLTAAAPSDRDVTGSAAASLAATDDGAGPLEPITEHVPSTDDRYALAGGCFVLSSPAAGGHVVRGDGGFAIADDAAAAEAFRFQAFDLGKYLLFGAAADFLAVEPGPAELADDGLGPVRGRLPVDEDTDLPRAFLDDLPDVEEPDTRLPSTRGDGIVAAAEPSALAEWVVRGAGKGRFRLHLPVDDGAEDEPGPSDVAREAPLDATLVAAEDGSLRVVDGVDDTPASVFVVTAAPDPAACADWPEAQLNVDGRAPTATNPVDEVRGYLDAHLHMMAFEFIGGRSRCGRPWHPYGPAHALVDCPDHEPGGIGAALEFALSGEPVHETAGWPDFPYWPRYDSLTHEQVYYRWLERAWQGGLRMFTNLLVDNNALCEAWPYKENSCNEMDGVRLQAQRLRELERYVDAQWGGPGEGWFRIVTDPFEARRTMNEGRLAVVMGIEVSVLFDCGTVHDVAQCTADDIDQRLAEVHDLGVRQMELVNKFDNALSGVTGDAGSTGIVVNAGNFQETGRFWQMRTCDEPEGHEDHQHDKTQPNLNDDTGVTGGFLGRDAIFGAVLRLTGTSGAAPAYSEGPHCNIRGLTELGRHLLRRMMERGMIFDPDHMSSLARQQALDLLEAAGYSGVVSSHSWADAVVYERTLRMGGVVTPYAGNAWSDPGSRNGFTDKWRRTRSWADDRYLFGIGYGADTNGFGSQGAPRNPADGEGVSYPFTGFGGVTVDRQVSGNQTYDINTDGVDHYGLYPDWIEDVRILLGDEGDDFLTEMALGPEAYLQTWERALGIANDACRDDRVDPAAPQQLAQVRRGMTDAEVLVALGQPHVRERGVFRYCTERGAAKVVFDDAGRVSRVDRGAARPVRDDAPPSRDAVGGAGAPAGVTAAAGGRVDAHGPDAVAMAPAAGRTGPGGLPTTTSAALLVALAVAAVAALRLRRDG